MTEWSAHFTRMKMESPLQDMTEWSAHVIRIKMESPLQKKNITVEKSAVAGKDINL